MKYIPDEELTGETKVYRPVFLQRLQGRAGSLKCIAFCYVLALIAIMALIFFARANGWWGG